MIWFFTSAILLAQAFTIFGLYIYGRNMMSAQSAIDAVVVQLARAREEIVSKIADLNVQIEDAGVKDVVDTSELVAAAQALDDIVPDVPEVEEGLPAEVTAE